MRKTNIYLSVLFIAISGNAYLFAVLHLFDYDVQNQLKRALLVILFLIISIVSGLTAYRIMRNN